jgi:hypothetical protein
MSKSEFRKALAECGTGNLRMTEDKHGHRLFCYTKQCFFDRNSWNETTISHRGRLYFENVKVNHPFKKIFNVDEVDSTQSDIVERRMKEEPYDVYDKANGHLFIMSNFVDSKGEQHVVFSTKGSLPNPENDLLNDDIKIFVSLYGEQLDKLVNIMPNCTLMFEAIVAHDKHSMYDLQVEQYGKENCFVLLGAAVNLGYDYDQLGEKFVKSAVVHSKHNNTTLEDEPWVECEWDQMYNIAQFIRCPIIEKYDEMDGTPKMWKEHTDREGYVIRFLTNNDRVKVKTDEYWKNRFKKDLTPEKILNMYVKGGIKLMQEKLPEEMANDAIDVITNRHENWYLSDVVDHKEVYGFIADKQDNFTSEDRKWLFTKSLYTIRQRQYIIAIIEGKGIDVVADKTLRNDFVEYVKESSNIYDTISKELEEVVYNAL